MKKIVLFIVSFLLMISSSSALNYVALGDSIANGYGLTNIDNRYVNLLNEELNGTLHTYTIDGINSTEFLELLNTGALDNDLKEADIVTISLGSNDILEVVVDTFITSVGSINNVSNSSMGELISLLKPFSEAIQSSETQELLNTRIETFKINWQLIIKYIKDLNSDVTIYVTNFYNPYYGINIETSNFNLGSISDSYIKLLNKCLTESKDYTIVDIYSIFNSHGLTNVSLASGSIDPHPNQKGHKAIYDAIYRTMTYHVVFKDSDGSILEEYNIYKGETVSPKVPVKEGYEFVKWSKDYTSINSDMIIIAEYKKINSVNYLLIGSLILSVLVVISFIIYKKKKS